MLDTDFEIPQDASGPGNFSETQKPEFIPEGFDTQTEANTSETG